jgi:hypothetical protein
MSRVFCDYHGIGKAERAGVGDLRGEAVDVVARVLWVVAVV